MLVTSLGLAENPLGWFLPSADLGGRLAFSL